MKAVVCNIRLPAKGAKKKSINLRYYSKNNSLISQRLTRDHFLTWYYKIKEKAPNKVEETVNDNNNDID